MLTVAEALALVSQTVQPFEIEARPLSDALGLVLAQSVMADIDSPPFDKSLMDGYAVRSSDIRSGMRELDIVDEVTAGRTPTCSVDVGQATRIMTGAPLPIGADAVIKVEDTETLATPEGFGRVKLAITVASPEQHIIRRGTSLKAGAEVLAAGRRLRAQELAALAEMGCAEVPVRRAPTIAVLATGDELVPIEQTPGPGQIRNTNETSLCAQIRQSGATAVPLGIARDERSHLRAKIEAGLSADILLLSGGVSAGKLDLVPSELADAGVQQLFHHVNLKPGKPLWFGVLHRSTRPCYVFGLPGNPVSTMVCFELFVRAAMRRLMGYPACEPPRCSAQLEHAYRHKDRRETYFPAALTTTRDGLRVRLLNWHGSSDLQATVDANALAVFPPEIRDYAAQDSLEVVPLN